MQMSPQDLFKKNNRYELLKMGCFATGVLINAFALPQTNKGCQFDSTGFNMLFFYMIILTETVLRITFQFFLVTN